jgi:lipopolysaccharide export LptBFGC system permease protein LptF
MRLLDRYLLRELLVPLGFCLGGFLVFWLAVDLTAEMDGFQRAKMGWLDVLEYYWFGLPELLVTVLPVGLLLALLYAVTNHARHHELTAMRAAGISLWRLCLPYLGLGLLFSLVLYGLNERWAPDGRERQEQLKLRRVRADAESKRLWRDRLDLENAAERRLWNIGSFHLGTAELKAPRVRLPMADSARRAFFARRAVWTNGMWRAYEVRESVWRHESDPEPVTASRPYLDFPVLPGSPTDVLRWEGSDWLVPIQIQVTNPGASLPVAFPTNTLWRTNLVAPPEAGLRWKIGAFNPRSQELHDLRVEVPLEPGAARLVIGETGGWEDGHWVFRVVSEFLFRGATDGFPMLVTHPKLVLPELTETPDMVRAEIRVIGQRRNRALRRPELTLRDIRDYRRLHPVMSPELTASLSTQFHARLAAPWTCLVVVLIAIPFSVPSGRRNLFYGVAGSIGIAFAYFVLQRFGFALGQSGQVPGWVAAWLPNAFFAVTGVVLISRVP